MRHKGETEFARVIEEHLELRRRNKALEDEMPINRYRVADPFVNHPLFKTEEEAQLEETLNGRRSEIDGRLTLAWSESEDTEEAAEPEDTLWGNTRDFDWGD